MSQQIVLVVSDIHYASDLEKQRPNYETAAVANPLFRRLLKWYRHFFWLRDPFAHNSLLDRVLEIAPTPDFVIANGDYSCDSAFVGVSDDAAFASANECLTRLRQRFSDRLYATIGDHELGKISLLGGRGGMRLRSWDRAVSELRLEPFWKIDVNQFVLLGITSSLIALPVFEPEALAAELPRWRTLREEHLHCIRHAFTQVSSSQRIILFCHDPTALPFLAREPAVQARLSQVELTMIGHLHTPLIFWKSQLLSGMPTVRWFGNSVRRMSSALHEAKHWLPFHPLLCPALAGIELLKDGGVYLLHLDPERTHVRTSFKALPR